MFANTIVFRSQVEDTTSFEEILEAAQAALVQAQEFQDVPFEKIVSKLSKYENIMALLWI